jgi:predicted secreted hydrolase
MNGRFHILQSAAWIRGFLLVPWILLAACSDDDTTTGMAGPDLGAVLGGDDTAGFERADAPRTFRFPEDHGLHAGFRNEWWYLTGNLFADNGRRFGYQLTFFNAALPPGETQAVSGDWAAERLWMAHLAVTDVESRRHWSFERFSRDNPQLAGATQTQVWLDDWQLLMGGPGQSWQIQAADGDSGVALKELVLAPRKEPVLQGREGLSLKNAGEGNASYYYSITRMETQGIVVLGEETLAVSGLSWLDREWSTSALADTQSGWNWFSLQLFDNQELMYYQLLDNQGAPDAFSSGNRTDATGMQHYLGPGDVRLDPVATWTGPDGMAYPIIWVLQTDELNLRIEAVVQDQFMDTLIPYWEGAIDVLDNNTGELLGHGYLEMVR